MISSAQLNSLTGIGLLKLNHIWIRKMAYGHFPTNYFRQWWLITTYSDLDPQNQLHWNWNQNTKFFNNKYELEDTVCKMAAIYVGFKKVRASFVDSHEVKSATSDHRAFFRTSILFIKATYHNRLCVIARVQYMPHIVYHGPLARYAKLRVRMRRECWERFPRHRR